MKKLCAFLLTLVLLLGCSRFYPAQALAAGGETSVAFSADVNLSASANVKTGDYAHYFDYRTCIVHTSHGDYAVYYTDTYKGSDGSKEMNRFSVIKILNGSAQVVYQDWKPYDSSQISLHVDNDENVWVLAAGDDGRLKVQTDGRGTSLNVAAYKIDAQTDEVTGFASVIKSKVAEGFGYAVSVMDPDAGKIYAVASGATSDVEKTALYWVSFDMNTQTWDSTLHSIPQVGRHCYHYIYPDGQGGLIVVDERDSLVSSTLTPYPEISNSYGIITGENYIEDADTHERFEGSRWSADYVWDQLDAYHITDAANASSANSVTVAAADYSRVTGSEVERRTLQARMRNEYPGTSNNSGDAFIDAQGNLHVLYSEAFSRAALDRVTTESTWYHKVYDANLNELTQGKGEMLVQEILGASKNFVHSAEEKLPVPSTGVTKNSNSFRMYEDNEGNLYLIQGQTLGIDGTETFSVNVYQITGDPASGYTYAKVGSQVVPGGSSNSVISISNNRSNSAKDNKIGLLYKQGGAEDYHYMQLTITPGDPPTQPGTDPTQQPSTDPTQQPGTQPQPTFRPSVSPEEEYPMQPGTVIPPEQSVQPLQPTQSQLPAGTVPVQPDEFVSGADSLSGIPATGDDTPLAAWTLLLAGGLAGLTALTLILRRKLKQ